MQFENVEVIQALDDGKDANTQSPYAQRDDSETGPCSRGDW